MSEIEIGSLGEIRHCKHRKCGKEFVDEYRHRRGARQLYCSAAHENAARQQRWRDRQNGLGK